MYCTAGRVSIIALAVVVGVSGCGRPNALGTIPVSGKVTYKNQPVEGATVSFIPDGDGRPATAITAADGRFQLTTLDSPGAIPGSYTATVRKTDIPLESTGPVSMEEAVKINARPPPTPKELIPSKYGDTSRSPLKFEVKAGQKNHFDLQLAD